MKVRSQGREGGAMVLLRREGEGLGSPIEHTNDPIVEIAWRNMQGSRVPESEDVTHPATFQRS